MMNLAELRERLQSIAKIAVDPPAAQPQQHVPVPKAVSPSPAFDIDNVPKSQEPSDWVKFIDAVMKDVVFPDEATRQDAITNLFVKAFNEIDGNQNKCNEAYAQLFVNFGRFKSNFVADDAARIFNQARCFSRRFAMVHIASAQFELERGNRSKALKLIEKALLVFEAKPKADLELALQQLKQGAHNILVSPPVRGRYASGQSHCSSGSESSATDELKLTAQLTGNISANLSSSISFSFPNSKNPPTQPVFDAPKAMSVCKPADPKPSHHIQEPMPVVNKHGHDTPEPMLVCKPADSRPSQTAPDPMALLAQPAVNKLSPEGMPVCKPTATTVPNMLQDPIAIIRACEPAHMAINSSRVTPSTPLAVDRHQLPVSTNSNTDRHMPHITTKSTSDLHMHHSNSNTDRHMQHSLADRYLQPMSTNSTTDRQHLQSISSISSCSTDGDPMTSDDMNTAPVSSRKLPTSALKRTEAADPLMVNDGSVHKRGMKCFRSTPLLNSERKQNPNIGPPSRVKRMNLPFAAMNKPVDEDHSLNNTLDSFKPLETKSFNNQAHTSGSHAHTSGYLSMVSEEGTIPMETNTDKPLPKMSPIKVVQVPKLSPVKVQRPEPVVQAKDPRLIPPVQPVGSATHVPQTPNNNRENIPPSAPTPMHNMKVITVNDHQYAVLSILGKGGSSKVYQVFDTKIKALKEVDLNSENDLIVEGYKNEIKLLQRLQYCDKVIKMYDSEFKKDENKLYVVMEAGSVDLATFFRNQTQNRKPLSDSVIWFYWERMLLAVQALHNEGIIHSDLKPANFLFISGDLKLIDFGIAKALQQDKTSVVLETQIGTLNYMSPEAIMDSCSDDPGNQNKPKFKIGVKSDVWSLGCILYNMVYGRTPFQHIKNNMKLQAIISNDFPINFPDIPNKHLIDVMKRCLNRDPKQRPSTDDLLDHPYLKAR